MAAKHHLVIVGGKGEVAVSAASSSEMSRGESITFPSLYIISAEAGRLLDGKSRASLDYLVRRCLKHNSGH